MMNKRTRKVNCIKCAIEFEMWDDYDTGHSYGTGYWCLSCFIHHIFLSKGFINSCYDKDMYLDMAYRRYPNFNKKLLVAELL